MIQIAKALEAPVSLPCTLRRFKPSEHSCRGSNNCYVWSLNFQQLKDAVTSAATETISNMETDDVEQTPTPSTSTKRNSVVTNETGDQESLLANEYSASRSTAISMNPSDFVGVRSRRNSRVSMENRLNDGKSTDEQK